MTSTPSDPTERAGLPPVVDLATWQAARDELLRCVEGARWTTYVPVEVTASGNGLILVRAVAAGQALFVFGL